MKKSTILVGVGAFIVVTSLLCINGDGKMYQKQKQFQTSNEVLEQLESNPILARNEKGEMTETDQFKECLSKRKRLTESQFNFLNLSVEKIEDLDEKEKEKEALIEDYNNLQKNFSKKRELKNVEPVRLDATINYPSYNNGEYQERGEKCKLDLILVDEGEGLVIDYVVQYATEEQKDKGDINAEG